MASPINILKFMASWIVRRFRLVMLSTDNGSDWFRGLREYGIFKFKSELTSNDLARIKKHIDSVITSGRAKIWVDSVGSDTRIFGAEKLFMPDYFNSLARRYAHYGEKYLGRRIHSFFVLAARMDYVEANIGSGGGWHRDSAFNHQFKVIVYLSDVDESNGPFQYIKQTHSPNLLYVFSPTLGESRLDDSVIDREFNPADIVTVTGRAGDAIFVDTKGVHRGRPIEAGSRYAITFYFFDRKVMSHVNEMTNFGVSVF